MYNFNVVCEKIVGSDICVESGRGCPATSSFLSSDLIRILNVDLSLIRLIYIDMSMIRILNVDLALIRILNGDLTLMRILNVDRQ